MSELHSSTFDAHAASIAGSGHQPFPPSAEEDALLAEHEPHIAFRLSKGTSITEGRQSRVSVLEYDHDGSTFQLVWKRMGAGKGLEVHEAREMRDRLGPYRTSLESCGWRVPKLFYTNVEKIGGESQIFSYEEFIPGGDGERMVANQYEPNLRKWYLIDKVLRLLYSYPQSQLRATEIKGRTLTLLPHGLDLKLANLVLEPATSQLYFVDLFGPKELDETGDWRIYSRKLDTLPADNLRVVTATREGAILRFWRLARKSWGPDRARRVSLRDQFVDHLESMGAPDEEFALIRDEIDESFPWLNALYSEQHV